jgi:hypothetical protein
MAQVGEHLPSKYKILSSNPNTRQRGGVPRLIPGCNQSCEAVLQRKVSHGWNILIQFLYFFLPCLPASIMCLPSPKGPCLL